MLQNYLKKYGHTKKGTILPIALIVVMIVSGLTVSILGSSNSFYQNARKNKAKAVARFIAKSGIQVAIISLNTGGFGNVDGNFSDWNSAVDKDNGFQLSSGIEASTLPSNNPASRVYSDVLANKLLSDRPSGDFHVRSIIDLGADGVADTEDDILTIVATGIYDGVTFSIEAIAQQQFGGVSSNPFEAAISADGFIDLNSNALVDSYQHSLGSYGSQTSGTNSNSGFSYSLTSGTVQSNDRIGLDSNAVVYGDAFTGTSGSGVTTSSNSFVHGSTTPDPEPAPVTIPDVIIPASSGSNYSRDSGSETFAAGTHQFNNFELDSTGMVTFTGPATVVIGGNFRLDSDSKLLVEDAAGAVEFLVDGEVHLHSNSMIKSTSLNPASINISTDSSDVHFDSNSIYYGTLIAPDALVRIHSNSVIFGAIIADRVDMDSNARVHFDEDLLNGEATVVAGTGYYFVRASRGVNPIPYIDSHSLKL